MTSYERFKNSFDGFKIIDKNSLDLAEIFSYTAYMQGLTDAFDLLYNLEDKSEGICRNKLWELIVENSKRN